MAVGSPFTEEYLHIAKAVEAPLKVECLHLTVAAGAPSEGGLLNYDLLRKILYERIIVFSLKMRKIYARNTSRARGGPNTGERDKCLARLPLNTRLLTLLTSISYISTTPGSTERNFCDDLDMKLTLPLGEMLVRQKQLWKMLLFVFTCR